MLLYLFLTDARLPVQWELWIYMKKKGLLLRGGGGIPEGSHWLRSYVPLPSEWLTVSEQGIPPGFLHLGP